MRRAGSGDPEADQDNAGQHHGQRHDHEERCDRVGDDVVLGEELPQMLVKPGVVLGRVHEPDAQRDRGEPGREEPGAGSGYTCARPWRRDPGRLLRSRPDRRPQLYSRRPYCDIITIPKMRPLTVRACCMSVMAATVAARPDIRIHPRVDHRWTGGPHPSPTGAPPRLHPWVDLLDARRS